MKLHLVNIMLMDQDHHAMDLTLPLLNVRKYVRRAIQFHIRKIVILVKELIQLAAK